MKTLKSSLLLLLLWNVLACASEEHVPATEVLVRVTATSDVKKASSAVRLRLASSTDEKDWDDEPSTTFDLSKVDWPLDLVVLPGKSGAAKSVEVIVEALDSTDDDASVIVQQRNIVRFQEHKALLLEVELATCGSRALSDLCESDADCHGVDCQTCVDGNCNDTPTPDDLPGWDGSPITSVDDEIDAGSTASRDAGARDAKAPANTTDARVSSGSSDARVASDSGQGNTDPGGSADAGGMSTTNDAGTGPGTAAPGETGRLVGITAAHNATREMVQTSPMLQDMTWDEDVAAYAQEWADELAATSCASPHHRTGADLQKKGYGENLATFGSTKGSSTAAQAVGAWSAEVSCWTYGTINGTEKCDTACYTAMHSDGCGHYTQVVWRKSVKVGCGVSTCMNGQFKQDIWICNYSPAGNYIGQAPY